MEIAIIKKGIYKKNGIIFGKYLRRYTLRKFQKKTNFDVTEIKIIVFINIFILLLTSLIINYLFQEFHKFLILYVQQAFLSPQYFH